MFAVQGSAFRLEQRRANSQMADSELRDCEAQLLRMVDQVQHCFVSLSRNGAGGDMKLTGWGHRRHGLERDFGGVSEISLLAQPRQSGVCRENGGSLA